MRNKHKDWYLDDRDKKRKKKKEKKENRIITKSLNFHKFTIILLSYISPNPWIKLIAIEEDRQRELLHRTSIPSN